MQGKIATQNCFDFKTKVPVVPSRFRPNLHWFWSMEWECLGRCLSHTVAMRGDGALSASRVKSPSVLPHFDQTCPQSWREGGGTRYISLIPLQCEARSGRKTVSNSRVKLPSLQPDFDETCTGCRAWPGECDVSFLSHPTKFCGQIGARNISATRVKCASLLADFDQTCSGCGLCGGGATWDV
jgi:hypothetical protein